MIRLSALTKKFRSVPVLAGLDLHLADGDRVALVGSNGAGKTTLIRCLLGEYRHDGTCTVDGRQPRRDRAALLPHVAFVPQVPPPLAMPVAELVRFTVETSGADAGAVAAVADQLGLDLDTVAARPFVRLSGGQKQKVLISLALGRQVRLLILDEPTANLDPAARGRFLALLAERSERTMLISSHRLDEIAPLVNRVVEMERGRVVLDDRVDGADDRAAPLTCCIRLGTADAALTRLLGRWGFVERAGTLTGTVPPAERWHFVSSLSRHSGALASIAWSSPENDHAPS